MDIYKTPRMKKRSFFLSFLRLWLNKMKIGEQMGVGDRENGSGVHIRF